MPVDWSMLPNDVVRLVMQHDRADMERMRRLTRNMICEFDDIIDELTHGILNDIHPYREDYDARRMTRALMEVQDFLDMYPPYRYILAITRSRRSRPDLYPFAEVF